MGNLLLGDEGVGIHVINRLKKIKLPPHIELVDGATGGFRLMPLFENYKNNNFIIVDAVKIKKEDRLELKKSGKNIKGDIYLIPLNKLYKISDEGYEKPGFISFHQTAISDVLLLMLRKYNIKIKGYLLGINITDPDKQGSFKTYYSMQLSEDIEKKIDNVIDIIFKHF